MFKGFGFRRIQGRRCGTGAFRVSLLTRKPAQVAPDQLVPLLASTRTVRTLGFRVLALLLHRLRGRRSAGRGGCGGGGVWASWH